MEHLPQLPFNGWNKTALKNEAAELLALATEQGNVLQLAENFKTLEEFLKQAKECDQYKAFNEAVREELAKYGGKYETASGAKIEAVETSVKYDYSYDSEWVRLSIEAERANNALKEREAKLKSIPPGKILVDEATGEAIQGAPKTSQSSFKITIKKWPAKQSNTDTFTV